MYHSPKNLLPPHQYHGNICSVYLPVSVDVIELHKPPSAESLESDPSNSSFRLSGFFDTFNFTILL